MEIVKQICPRCGTRLKITRVDNSPSMAITCPVCRNTFTSKFNTPPPIPAAGTGNLRGKSLTETVLKPGASSSVRAMSCSLNCHGMIYQLHSGRNIIGRRSPSSRADIQVHTNDHFMSRQHACINVKENRVTINKMPGNDQAQVFVDGMRLVAGDEVKLLPGSIIIMGNTQLVVNIAT